MSEQVQIDRTLVQQIRDRHAAIRARIAERTDRDVRIVCVTKGHPVGVAAAALAAGFTDLGENYAQELLAKAAVLGGDGGGEALQNGGEALQNGGEALQNGGEALQRGGPRWHFIGRLQSNKVRQLASSVQLWHTVDRSSLAREIARRAPGAAVLVQLDLAGLEGRGGIAPADAPELVSHCRDLGLDVVGLMGVGVPGPPALSRDGFRRLNDMADDLGLVERSMGMSADLEVAVTEGATIVRVGSALVGARVVPPRSADG